METTEGALSIVSSSCYWQRKNSYVRQNKEFGKFHHQKYTQPEETWDSDRRITCSKLHKLRFLKIWRIQKMIMNINILTGQGAGYNIK
jgi:hypothetical protein